MRFGLGELRLAPRDFWAMTLPELRAALGHARTPPPPRAALDDLMLLFPDPGFEPRPRSEPGEVSDAERR